jgi:acyl-CoA thioesterase-1
MAIVHFTRRVLIGALASILAALPTQAQAPTHAQEQTRAVVVLFGDSISAGYGLPPDQGLAAALQVELQAIGVDAVVRNAGLPGDTSAGGRGRMTSVVRRDTDVCVVEFGGNDRARGFAPEIVRENLEAIIDWLQSRHTTVVLTGMKLADTGDPAAAAFNAVFPEVARRTGVLFYPDLMAGVSRTSGLRQADGIHPSAEGARVIARGLAPLVARALEARR